MKNKRAIRTLSALLVLTAAAALSFAATAYAFDGNPKLAIPIPTIKFTDMGNPAAGTTYGLPWIAEYISGLYRYSVNFAGIIGTVMIIIGGFQYLTAGGDVNRVKAGKQRIADAIMGMLLLIGSYVVLYTVNPDLVTLRSISLRGVDPLATLMAKEGGSGFADKTVFEKGIPGAVADQTPPPSGAPEPGKPIKNVAVATVEPEGAKPAEGGAPAPTSSDQKIDVVDLYQPNKYGVIVKGTKPAERMKSVCVGKLWKNPGGDSKEEVLERAAAVTRVWINESMSNGAIYSRGDMGTGNAGNAQYEFTSDVFGGTSAGPCMREKLAGQGITAETITRCNACRPLSALKQQKSKDQAKMDKLAATCGNSEEDCKLNGRVEVALRGAYEACWVVPLKSAGILGGDCVTYNLQLAACAFGKNVPGVYWSPKTKPDMQYKVGKPVPPPPPSLDGQTWLAEINKIGGPQPFDFYAVGGCHSFMYIGGLGLKTSSGQDMHWIEMGGGGPSAESSGKAGSSGAGVQRAKVSFLGGTLGISVYLNKPVINVMQQLGCYNGNDKYVKMTRLLKMIYGF